MKQQAIHFVGLDVHQSTVVASVRDESGKVVMKATVPMEESVCGAGPERLLATCEDSTRVMLPIKAIFRADAIPTPGVSVYRTSRGKDLAGEAHGRSVRSSGDAADVIGRVARAAAEGEGGDDRRGAPAARVESAVSIPFLGPVRVAQTMAIMRTLFRFRTKRNLWPYAGLAVVKESSANQELKNGKLQLARRRR